MPIEELSTFPATHFSNCTTTNHSGTLTAGIQIRHDRGEYRWKEGLSAGGIRYRTGVRERIVPPIPQQFLDCSIYLYRSVKLAQDGDNSGGSGFLVHVPSEHGAFIYVYAVTNKHVVDNGYHVLRLNTVDGKSDAIPSDPESWTFHPDGDDIAVMPIASVDTRFKWSSISVADFVSQEILKDYGMGPGDDVFLVGRLITAAGHQRNTPVVRFGNLSMMADPKEPVILGEGHEQESFLVECRSLSGFSGSPVFVTTTQTYGKDRIPKRWRSQSPTPSSPGVASATFTPVAIEGTFGPWLLGIDCAHVPLWRPVYEKDRKTQLTYQVEANTGIACTIPAWRILELLNDDELVKVRKRDDAEIAKENRNAAIPDSSL